MLKKSEVSKQPLVSVIVPVYNLENYLEKSLLSLWKQTYQNFEVICINDGSTDNSLQLLKKIANEHPNMLVMDKPNGGVSSARNMGLEQIKGDYIYFLDADDIMHPQLLEILVTQIQKYDADIACCNYIKTVDLDSIKFENYNKIEPDVYSAPLKKFLMKERFFSYSLWSKLYKRQIVGKQKFVENIHYGEDMLFNLELFSKADKVVKINEPLYFYIERPTSCVNTSFNDKKAKSFINLLQYIGYNFHNHHEYPLIRRNISSLQAKFLIKNVYKSSMSKKYASDLWKLYKLKLFNLKNLGIKNNIYLVKIFLSSWQVFQSEKNKCHDI